MARYDLERLKREFPAWRIIGERVELRRQGAEFVGICPFHAEASPSFHVYQERDGQWLWKCFGCNAAGNVFQFLQKAEGLPFDAAVERVVQAAGWATAARDVDATFAPPFRAAQPKESRVWPLDRWLPFERALARSPQALEWLQRERGISGETAKRLHLGFFCDIRAVAPSDPLASEPWLGLPSIRDGTVVSIKLRCLTEKRFARVPGMETALFNEQATDPFDDLFVTEGEFDALALEQAGFRAVSVPSAGYTLTPQMRDAILGADTVYLAGDADPAGRNYMDKLWAELRERTYRLDWPEPHKDANEFFLKCCDGDIEKFRSEIERLKREARQRPLPNFYALSECLAAGDLIRLEDHPLRMRFPWKPVDEMAVILPGDVVSVFATYTGTGKSTWLAASLIEEARQGRVIVLYSAELTPAEYATLVASYLTRRDRRRLEKSDYERAAEMLGDARFYVGYSTELNRIGQVLDLVEWAVRRLGATHVALDHLHFLCRNAEDQVREQENAMQRIKNLALKYRVIFFVVGQSRKPLPQAKGKPSEMADAKGSEAFSSDANAVFHLHRELKRNIDWDNPPDDLLDPMTQVRLQKARAKGSGRAAARLRLEGAQARFVELVPESAAQEVVDWHDRLEPEEEEA